MNNDSKVVKMFDSPGGILEVVVEFYCGDLCIYQRNSKTGSIIRDLCSVSLSDSRNGIVVRVWDNPEDISFTGEIFIRLS